MHLSTVFVAGCTAGFVRATRIRRKCSIFPSPYARARRAFNATIASAWAGVSWPSTIQVPGPGM